MKKILILTGEASGDLHGANLIRALKRLKPELEIHASGGDLVRACEPASFTESARVNVTGLTAVLRVLPEYFRMFGKIRRAAEKISPDLVVFIDNPGFNLRMAQNLFRLGYPMVYYICPQVWAWNQGRVKNMKEMFDKLLVIFEFEKRFYEERGLEAVWVGHPLKDVIPATERRRPWGAPRNENENPLPEEQSGRNIILMPGSRMNEIKYLLPVILEAAGRIKAAVPEAHFTLIKADTIDDAVYGRYLDKCSAPVIHLREGKYAALQNADLALLCSGTATLECSMFHLPMIVLNKGSELTARVVQRVIKVPYFAIPNLLAGRMVVPELLQWNCTPEKVAAKAIELLENPDELPRIRQELTAIDQMLGAVGASERAAMEILKVLE